MGNEQAQCNTYALENCKREREEEEKKGKTIFRMMMIWMVLQ
jgi:hypothetical protein